MPNMYVADVIEESYKTWDSQKPVIIHAPTGTGKTHFILNVLLPYIQSQEKRLVYVANRSALEQQVQSDIPDRYRNSIVTCSYQQLPYFHYQRIKKVTDKRSSKMEAIASADYYVLDEAHYFLADASFNSKVEACFKVLEYLKSSNKNSVWIYMTATAPYLLLQLHQPRIDVPYLDEPEYYSEKHFHSVKALLKYKETKRETVENTREPLHPYEIATGHNYKALYLECFPASRKSGCFCADYFINKTRSLESELFKGINERHFYYCIRRDFSYITPVYFDKWNEIEDAIRATPSDEKWVIFVSNTSVGEALKDRIKDSVFLSTARRKNQMLREHDVFQEIVYQAKFSQRVLISTKVLDNGVNLKDISLQHMVIDTFDETTFLQIVGRKRLTGKNDKLRLYLKNESEGTIRKQFGNHVLQILVFWHNLLKVKQSNRNPQCFLELNSYEKSKYTEDEKFKYPFVKYIEPSNMALSNVQNMRIKDNPALLFDMYHPAVYSKRKLTYDYYKMMAMFEKAQNERFAIANMQGIKTESEYMEIEKQLQENQFMWLKQQLSWLGLNDSEHDPSNPKHWITSQSGQASRSYQALVKFLSAFEPGAVLSIGEEESLKELFRNWIQNVRPKHKDADSQGSIAVINRCFDDYRMPYRIESKKKMIERKQRNWWIIRKITS